MTGEDLWAEDFGYRSEKLPERKDGFSRSFKNDGLSGLVSDGIVLKGKDPQVAYIVGLGAETPRLIKIDPRDLDGVTGEEEAVKRAIEQRKMELFGKIVRGNYGRKEV